MFKQAPNTTDLFDTSKLNNRDIPNSIIGLASELLGEHYYSHSRLNALFMQSGAPGDAPDGNCVNKCIQWYKNANLDPETDALSVLGMTIANYLDFEVSESDDVWLEGRKKLLDRLQKNGLSYIAGGKIAALGFTSSTKSFRDMLRARDLGSVDQEFNRAIETVDNDPSSGVTAACALLESLCKVYIEDEQLPLPSKQSLRPLWKTVSENLGFDPKSVEDQDLQRVLTGALSIVDGISALRTHAGSAHGQGRTKYQIKPRHARLVINAAHTLCVFVIESWDDRSA